MTLIGAMDQSAMKDTQLTELRGVKGSKVLRTRKIKLNKWNSRGAWSLFCSQGCYNDFFHKYVNEIVAIAPRTECLETPIHDPKKTTTILSMDINLQTQK